MTTVPYPADTEALAEAIRMEIPAMLPGYPERIANALAPTVARIVADAVSAAQAEVETQRAEVEKWQQKWKRRGKVIERLEAERETYRQESAEHLALLDGQTAVALVARDRGGRS